MTAATAYAANLPSGSAASEIVSQQFTAFAPGQILYLSFYYQSTRTTGSATDTVTMKINWYNSSNTLLTPTSSSVGINGTSAGFVLGNDFAHTAPATAVKGEISITITPGSSTTQHNIYLKNIRLGKTALSANLTTNTNQLVDGAQLGSTATWSGVTGTGRPSDYANVAALGDTNRVYLSQFEKGYLGWGSAENVSLTPGITTGVLNGMAFFRSYVIFTGAGQVIGVGSNTDQGGAYPCTAGERLFVGFQLGIDAGLPAGSTWDAYICWLDSTNTEVTPRSLIGTGSANGGAPFIAASRYAAFVTVPTGAVKCFLRYHLNGNGSSGGVVVGIYVGQPMICGAAANQTAWPTFTPGPSAEIGAEVNRYIQEIPQSLTFKYDYTGAALTGQFSRNLTLKLVDSSGNAITSGVTWTGIIISGGFNNVTAAFGPYGIGSSAGVGTQTVSSLETSDCVVEWRAAYAGQTYTMRSTLKKDIASAPVGGSGGGATTIGSATSFSSFNSTSFANISGNIVCSALPSGKTSTNISVQLDGGPSSGTNTNSNVEIKIIRQNPSTTQIGTTQSDYWEWDSSSGIVDPASFSFSFTDTGLTPLTVYTYEIDARLTSGTRTINLTGTVTITA